MTEAGAEKACVVCAHAMPVGAKKCTTCGEYQSFFWRLMAGLDLRGLLALLPLATLIYAFLAERLEVPRSDLRLHAVACTADAVTVFASNGGNRTGILAAAAFDSGDGDRTLPLPADPAARLFDGGASRLLTLPVDRAQNPGGLVSFESRQVPDCTVALKFRVIRFDHTDMETTSSCDCPAS